MIYNTDSPGEHGPLPSTRPTPSAGVGQSADPIQELRAEHTRYGQLINTLIGLRKQTTDQQKLNVLFFDHSDPIASSMMVTSSDDIRMLIDTLILLYRSRQSMIFHQCSMHDSTPA